MKHTWNTMECERESFSGALGGARETHWQCVSHCLKARLNILSLALSWALWCCLCCTHLIFNRVEPPLKAMWNTFSVCLACSAERAIEAISLALHSVSHRLKVMWKVDITSQFFWTTFRLVFNEIRPGR